MKIAMLYVLYLLVGQSVLLSESVCMK